jgi:RND family efflux transporter MFP subunit
MRVHRDLSLAVLGSVLILGCGGDPPEPERVIRPVRYQEVYSTGSGRVRSFSGVAKAGMETNLSFKVAGTIRRLPVKVGDQVRAGQLIADLDPEDYELQVQDAEAALSRSQAESRNAEADYERVRALYENKSASLNDLDGARATSESAKAQVSSAEKRLEMAQLQLSYTRLSAPVAGGISAVDVEVNENVGTGRRVVLLTGESELEVEVSVPEGMITSIREGDEAIARFDALPDQDFAATVTEVGVSATGGATTYPVTVSLAENPEAVRPGMAATVNFQFESQGGPDVILVPAHAVSEDAAGRFVYVVEPTGDGLGIARRREVVVGEISDLGLEILSGLSNGDLLVTAGVSRIRDGLEVKVSAEP